MGMGEPTAVQGISGQIIDRLRTELLAGSYPGGVSLREEELARRFRVSRQPIRKALQQLAHEGLVIARPHHGVTVPSAGNPHLVKLLNPLRKQLETYALRICMPLWSDKMEENWTRILATMAYACERGDRLAMLEADFAFHRELLESAGLEDMVSVWRGVIGRMRDHHWQSNERLTDPKVVVYIHKRLLGLFRAGDMEVACAALESHIDNAAFNEDAKTAYAMEVAGAAPREPAPQADGEEIA